MMQFSSLSHDLFVPYFVYPFGMNLSSRLYSILAHFLHGGCSLFFLPFLLSTGYKSVFFLKKIIILIDKEENILIGYDEL